MNQKQLNTLKMLKAIQLGQQLTKKEMKEIKGGGTCCTHTLDWSERSCGLSIDDAQAGAGNGIKWCCDSCGKSMAAAGAYEVA
jgi:hypothetical protein